MVRRLRFHGRGGEGVKLANRIVSRAAFLAGYAVQDSPLYGAERRGAPVAAFTRYDREPIRERGYIEAPDAVIVMDDSLFEHPEAAVLDGLAERSVLLANSAQSAAALKERYHVAGRVASVDLTAIALELLAANLLSAPVAGLTVKAIELAPWELLARALRVELASVGVSDEGIARNLYATRAAYDRAPALPLLDRLPAPRTAAPTFVVPRLPARLAAPAISVPANSLQRSTAGWRVFRPEIDRERCTRCILCFALCPDGAIRLDADNYPVVDYEHCKGCLVCATECPPQAIGEVRAA